uniref:Uncharacterized protein n=1 Tax=Caenorhabditis japonica TaxID=281687 RepID=A0A8R1EFM3_CAEJA
MSFNPSKFRLLVGWQSPFQLGTLSPPMALKCETTINLCRSEMKFKVSSSSLRCSSPHHLTASSLPPPLHHRSHSDTSANTSATLRHLPPIHHHTHSHGGLSHHYHHHHNHPHNWHRTMTTALEKCTTSLSEIHRLLRG